jgi:uncharacterized membrane protein AbrB (regulator of aidB expression)
MFKTHLSNTWLHFGFSVLLSSLLLLPSFLLLLPFVLVLCFHSFLLLSSVLLPQSVLHSSLLLPSLYDSTQTEAYCMEREVLFFPHLLCFILGLHCGSKQTAYAYSVIQEVTGGAKRIFRHLWTLTYFSGF